MSNHIFLDDLRAELKAKREAEGSDLEGHVFLDYLRRDMDTQHGNFIWDAHGVFKN